MMNLIQLDAIKVAASSKEELQSILNVMIKQIMRQTITLHSGTVTDGSPDIKLVLANAGHIFGLCIMSLSYWKW